MISNCSSLVKTTVPQSYSSTYIMRLSELPSPIFLKNTYFPCCFNFALTNTHSLSLQISLNFPLVLFPIFLSLTIQCKFLLILSPHYFVPYYHQSALNLVNLCCVWFWKSAQLGWTSPFVKCSGPSPIHNPRVFGQAFGLDLSLGLNVRFFFRFWFRFLFFQILDFWAGLWAMLGPSVRRAYGLKP